MARINIEDSLFKDNRFADLILKLGSRTLALGAIVEAYLLAQRHYLTTVNDRLIPLNEWKKARIHEEIIEVGLAEIREKGVYVCGSETQFSWLIQRQNAGKSPKTKKIVKEKRPLGSVNRNETEVNGSKPLPLSLSLSLSQERIPFSSKKEGEAPEKNRSLARGKKESLNLDAKEIIAGYADAFKTRYSAAPFIDSKDVGQLLRILKHHSRARLLELVQVYVQMDDPFFIKKKHDLATFLKSINQVAVARQTGVDPDRKKNPFDFLNKEEKGLAK